MTRAALVAAATTFALPASASALALSVSTSSPQDVAATRVTLRAKVSVAALGANVSWQYGASTAYGATSGVVSTGLVGVDQTLTLPVAGLAPDTTYHVRAVAVSGLSTVYGQDVKFKTQKGSSGSGSSGPGSAGGDDDPGDDDSSGPGPAGADDPAPAPSPPPAAPAPATTPKAPAKSTATTPPAADPAPGTPSSDDGATAAPGVATAAVSPVLGRSLGAATVQGTVTATSPSGAPVDLTSAATVPTGTLIDARAGTVELKTALDRKGTTQTGHFWGGKFEVRQSASGHGLTQIVLRGGSFAACPATIKAVASKATRKKPPRSLWGSDDHGRFQTRGRGSVATVRGTHWLTQDTCAGTLTRVLAGAVSVHDLRRDRTVLVAHGHEYLARR